MRTILAVFLIIWPLIAGCPEGETEMKIHGDCTVSGPESISIHGICFLETMTPRAGFNNLYHVVIKRPFGYWIDSIGDTDSGEPGIVIARGKIPFGSVPYPAPKALSAETQPIADFVKAKNFHDGSIVLTSLLWGSVSIQPHCEEIRASIASRAPAFEIRPQTIFISMLDSNTLEIRIEERWGEFYDGKPSPEWTARHLESFLRLSRAK